MILDEIGTYLQTQGHGTLGTDLFTGVLPSTPNSAVAVFETPGMPPMRTQGKVTLERPYIQVRCRDASYAAARTKAQSIWDDLLEITNTTLSGVRYLDIVPIQSPFLMARDANDLVEVAFNAEVVKEPS